MIKFWAVVYRLTGWYSPFARVEEYRYISRMLPTIAERLSWPGNRESLETLVSVEIGYWQAENGFAR